MRKKLSYKTKFRIAAVVSGVLVIGLAAGAAVSYHRMEALKADAYQKVTLLQQKVTTTRRTGYVASADIKMGTLLTENMLVQSTDISSDVPQELFITDADLGKAAVVDISMGQPVLTNMVTNPLTDNFHERECGFIWLNSNLEDYDYVDIRILYTNGEDYVVAAKKAVTGVSIQANNCFVQLTEEEILSLDAAIVDANLHGAKIYTTKYIKPALQEASVVNYNPNTDVIQLMSEDPNIVSASARELSVKARNDVEKRLKLFKEAYPEYEYHDSISEDGDKTPDAVLKAQEAAESGETAGTLQQGINAGSGGDASTTIGSTEGPIDDTGEKETDINYGE